MTGLPLPSELPLPSSRERYRSLIHRRLDEIHLVFQLQEREKSRAELARVNGQGELWN
jgi:hypothetical protein